MNSPAGFDRTEPPATRLDRRLIGSITIGLVLAAALGLQAASSVIERWDPEIAASLNAGNGLALEQWAFGMMQDQATSEDLKAMAGPAQAAQPIAIRSYRSEPLVPKSHVVLALASPDAQARKAILEQAWVLNRRDLALQSLVLQSAVDEGDFRSAIGTLDRILRVHPEYYDRFFPVLRQALIEPGTEEVFARLLDGSSPWHERFLIYVVNHPPSRRVLARIRDKITIDNASFDRGMVNGLTRQGDFEAAAAVYTYLRNATQAEPESRAQLSWNGEYPPFDWLFTDERALRAQPSLDGEELELFARPGEGGLVAQRFIAAPPAGTRLSVSLTAPELFIPGQVRLELECAQSGASLGRAVLERGTNTIAIPEADSACQTLRIDVIARVRREDPTLRSSLSKLSIAAPADKDRASGRALSPPLVR